MKLQILGSGCPTCHKLNQVVRQIVKELGLKVDVEYLTGSEGTQRIIELGLMKSPVLVIGGQVAKIGFDGDIDQLRKMIKARVKKQGK